MSDFTVEGIIEVDATRGIRGVRKFKNELRGLMADLEAVDKAIDRLDGRDINVAVKADTKGLNKVRTELEEIDVLAERLDNKKIDLDVDVDSKRIVELADALDSLEDKDINVGVKGDTSKTLSDFEKLRREYEAMGVELPVDFEGITDDIEKLEAQIKSIGGEKVDIGFDLQTEEAILKAKILNERLERELSDVDVNVDSAGLDNLTDSANKANRALSGGSGGSVGTAGLIGAVVGLSAVVAAMSPAVAGMAGAMVGSFAVAGTAVGAFGLLAAPTLKETAEGMKALSKATEGLEGAEKLRAYEKALKDIDPTIRPLVEKVWDLREAWMSAAEELRPDVISALVPWIGTAKTLLGEFTPIAKEAAAGIGELGDRADEALKGDNWQRFFDYVKTNAQDFIVTWGTAVGNFVTGIANMIVAFDPLTKMFNEGFLGMSESFLKWTEGLDQNKSWQNFVKFVQETGPLVWDTLGEVITAFINVGRALAPLGVQLLEFINKTLETYNAWAAANPELNEAAVKFAAIAVVAAPLVGYLGNLFGPLMGIAEGIGSIITAGIGRVPGLFTGVGGAAAAGAGGVSAMAIAIGAVVIAAGAILGVLAFLKTDTEEYKVMVDKLKEAWDVLRETGEKIWENLKKLWDLFEQSGAIEQVQIAFANFADVFKELAPILEPIVTLLGGALLLALVGLAINIRIVSEAVKFMAEIIGWAVEGVVAAFQWLFDVLVGHSIIPDLINAILDWFRKLPEALAGLVGAAKDRVIAKFTELANGAREKAGQAKDWVVEKFTELVTNAGQKWDNLKTSTATKFGEIANTVRTKAEEVRANAQQKFEAARAAIAEKVESMRSNAVQKWNALISSGREILGRAQGMVSGAFSGAGQWLWNAGQNIIGGLIRGIEAGFSRVRSTLSSLTSMLPDWKGPKQVDLHLLEPTGGWIIDGLISGINNQRSELRSELGGMTKMISSAFNNETKMVSLLGDGSFGGALGGMALGTGSTINNYYDVTAEVPLGASKAEVGGAIVEAITAFEEAGGRK